MSALYFPSLVLIVCRINNSLCSLYVQVSWCDRSPYCHGSFWLRYRLHQSIIDNRVISIEFRTMDNRFTPLVCSAKSSALYTVWRHKIQYWLRPYNIILISIFMVSCTDKTTNACVHELYYIHLQHPFITCNITVNLLEVIQLFTVVFHILFRRLPLQKHVTLQKIGGHMVFADSQSGSF